jgi:hypothetical protein
MNLKLLIKLALCLSIGLLFANPSAFAGEHYKLQIKNVTWDGLKLKWYCKGKRVDMDTFPPYKKISRELSTHKCPNIEDLTIKIYPSTYIFKRAMNGYVGLNAYKNMVSSSDFHVSNLPKIFLKSSFLTEIKFDKIPGGRKQMNGRKKCIAVMPDAYYMALYGGSAAIYPAFYPRKC